MMPKAKNTVFFKRVSWLSPLMLVGILVESKKRMMGIFPWVQKTSPNAKNRAPGTKTPDLRSAPRALRGAFGGVPADSSRRTWRKLAVTWHFGRLALSNTSSVIALGGQTIVLVAARPKKSPFFSKRSEQAKKAQKGQKSVPSQCPTTVASS